MLKLRFNATVDELWEQPTQAQLQAAAEVGEASYDSAMFGVRLLLARLSVRNGNGHKLTVQETQAAIERLADRPHIPGDYDHRSPFTGTSTRVWIEGAESNAQLWLEGVFWTRAISKDLFEETVAAFKDNTLGASWEIDKYKLEADESEENTQLVKDFELSGFALVLHSTPADIGTRGNVNLTATEGGENVEFDREETGFWERYFYEFGKEGEVNSGDSIDAKRLTYQERQKLPDSAFAYVKTIEGKSGKKIKVRRFPIQDEAHRKNALARLPVATDLTSEEKGAIFRKALARGKKAGDGWVEKYKGYNTSTWPPKPPKKAGLAGRDMMRPYLGDLPIGFLRDIPCPVCGAGYGRLKKADFQDGVFEMQCGGEMKDPEETPERHRFSVSLVVKAIGQKAEYLVAALEEFLGDDTIATEDYIMRTVLKPVEEVNKMAEYSEEQIAELKKKAAEEAVTAKETAEAALAAEKENQKTALDEAVVDKVKTERAEAVAAHTATMKLGLERLEALEELKELKFETVDDRLAALTKYGSMSEEDFATETESAKRDKELTDAKTRADAAEAELKKRGISATLPAGDDKLPAEKPKGDPMVALTRI